MPDIISRIRLEATGADQVAREISKIKDAYDDTAQAAQGVSKASVGGAADPFTQATQRGGAAGAETTTLARQERSRLERDNYDRRMAEHYRPAGQAGGFQQAMQVSRMTGGTLAAAQGGDIQGAVAGGGGFLATLGKISPLIAILGGMLGLGAIGMKKELGAIGDLYESGITRRLGVDYRQARELQIGIGRTGVTIDEINALYGGLGAAGGFYAPKTITNMAERMSRYGIAPDVMGGFMATAQRAGGWGDVDERSTQLLARTFGVGRTGGAMQQIAQMLEEAMSRGAQKGSLVLERGAERIAGEAAAMAQFGNVSMESAFGILRGREARVVSGARPTTPIDVMTLRAVQSANPEMSLFEAQVWIQQNPTAARNMQDEMISRQFGGAPSQMGRAYMGLGMQPYEAATYMAGMTGLGAGGLDYGAPVVSDIMKVLVRTKQLQILPKFVGPVIDKLLGWLEGAGGGELPPEPGTPEYDKLMKQLDIGAEEKITKMREEGALDVEAYKYTETGEEKPGWLQYAEHNTMMAKLFQEYGDRFESMDDNLKDINQKMEEDR